MSNDDLTPKTLRRHWVQLAIVALVLIGLVGTAPSLTTVVLVIQGLLMPMLAVTLGFYTVWWGILDYEEADMQRLFGECLRGNLAAGVALLGKVLIFAVVVFAVVFGAKAETPTRIDKVPAHAHQYLPELGRQIDAYWSTTPSRAYPAALIHHESGCPALRSCWSPAARLKTAREEGAGLGQITRAWRADGTERFDAMADARARWPAALGGLTWANVYQRPDLQMRTVVLMLADLDRRLADAPAATRLDFIDPAYNGGLGGVRKERALCAATPGCDPTRWWGHVERHCLKSRAPLYGTRSACDINRHHVVAVRLRAEPAYRPLMARRELALGVAG